MGSFSTRAFSTTTPELVNIFISACGFGCYARIVYAKGRKGTGNETATVSQTVRVTLGMIEKIKGNAWNWLKGQNNNSNGGSSSVFKF